MAPCGPALNVFVFIKQMQIAVCVLLCACLQRLMWYQWSVKANVAISVCVAVAKFAFFLGIVGNANGQDQILMNDTASILE